MADAAPTKWIDPSWPDLAESSFSEPNDPAAYPDERGSRRLSHHPDGCTLEQDAAWRQNIARPRPASEDGPAMTQVAPADVIRLDERRERRARR